MKVSDTGQVIYQSEKQACHAFPDPQGDGTRAGVNRNFQILSPLDFLADFTQHIPPKGSHLIRYYGWYSNKSRGVRKKTEADVIEAILKHCRLWQSRSSRAPPDVHELVLELDANCGNSLDTPVEDDESQELTYVDIDTFLESF